MDKTLTIIFDTSDEKREILSEWLVLFNFSKTKFLPPSIYEKEFKKFWFYVYENSEIIWGCSWWIDDGNWVFLDLLFINENHRFKWIGSSLIKKIFWFAQENCCIWIRTETWEFQAKEFYEKLGFSLYGKLDNHPRWSAMFLLKKEL